VEAFGFAHATVGVEWDASDPDNYPDFFPPPEVATDTPAQLLVRMLGVLAERAIPDLVAVGRDWQPDLIVRTEEDYASPIAAELLGIPHVSIGSDGHCAIDSPDYGYPVGNRRLWAAQVAELRAAFELPPDPDNLAPFRYLHMCFIAPGWAADNIPRPANTRFLRFEPARLPGPQPALPEWFTALPTDRPIVLAAVGTIHPSSFPGLLEGVVSGLAGEPVSLVVAIGRKTDPTRFGTVPPNVHLEPYVPQAQILEQCDLFVSHGGYNSVREAMHAGVPMVITPIGLDQPYVAQRCQALGLAESVADADRTPDAIRQAATAVLADPSYRIAAMHFSAQMKAQPGHDHMIELLQKVAELSVKRC
jgi:UDP:flavonoid glycosyltransferase YjiC (YdhE family)